MPITMEKRVNLLNQKTPRNAFQARMQVYPHVFSFSLNSIATLTVDFFE